MFEKLSQEQRDMIQNSLTEEQKEFLQNKLKRGYRTIFANEMARMKGIMLPLDADPEEIEQLLDEWVLVDFIDSGVVTTDTPCECGRPLRYQYTVEHQSTGRKLKFGQTHLQEHTGLNPQTVRDIIKGFGNIDYELDELLVKINTDWSLDKALTDIKLPTDLSLISLPLDIQKHIDLQLPLLDRQFMRMKKLLREKVEQSERESYQLQELEREEVIEDASYQQQEIFSSDYQLDLFGIQEENVQDEYSTRKIENLGEDLPQWLKERIFHYLEKGISSARIICEALITEDHAPRDRYITGKPKIYAPVCRFIDSLSDYRLKDGNHDNRYYEFLVE
jgi:hypothetical protein